MQREVSPVIILGMHRSGTSMLARALSECGLFLGASEDLLPALSDNPEGYWEDPRAIEVNDEILVTFGGHWARPPAMPPGWIADPRLEGARKKAKEFIASFAGRESWGWKDPRTMLTLPFWLDICPQAKLILIWRHPLEVALSLAKRAEEWEPHYVQTFARAFYVWERYNEAALEALRGKEAIATSYDRLLASPHEELKRICTAAGIEAPTAALPNAAGRIGRGESHKPIGSAVMAEPFFGQRTRQIYCDLFRLSGDQETKSDESDIAAIYRSLLPLAFEQLAYQAAEADGYWVMLERLKSEDAVLRHENRTMVEETSALQAQVADILASRSFRLGNRIVRTFKRGG